MVKIKNTCQTNIKHITPNYYFPKHFRNIFLKPLIGNRSTGIPSTDHFAATLPSQTRRRWPLKEENSDLSSALRPFAESGFWPTVTMGYEGDHVVIGGTTMGSRRSGEGGRVRQFSRLVAHGGRRSGLSFIMNLSSTSPTPSTPSEAKERFLFGFFFPLPQWLWPCPAYFWLVICITAYFSCVAMKFNLSDFFKKILIDPFVFIKKITIIPNLSITEIPNMKKLEKTFRRHQEESKEKEAKIQLKWE